MPFQDMPGGVAFTTDGPQGDTSTKSSALGAFGYHALGASPAAAAGLAAGIPGAEAGALIGAGAGPIGAAAGGIIGGLATGIPAAWATSYAQKKLLDANPTIARALKQDDESRAQQEQEHPIASFAGDVAPNLAAFRPASINPLTGFGYLSKGVTAAEKVTGIVNAGVSGATELGQQMAGDQPVDLTKVALATGVGALGMRETFIGRGIAGVGRRALPASMRPEVVANDGTADVGAAGGAGVADGTSTTNQPFRDDPNALDTSLGPDAAAATPVPQGIPYGMGDASQGLDLQGGSGGQPPLATAMPDTSTPIRGPMQQAPAPPPMAERAPQPQNPSPPGQQDLLANPVNNVAMDFSPIQVLRRLRDAAGTPEKPATPDSYMLQLANAISKHISVDDPEGHAIHGYLADQLQTLDVQSEQIKDHVIDNQVKKTNTPEQVEAQAQRAKDLDSARTQTEKQIKTLTAATDAMPAILEHLGERTGNANREQAALTAFAKRQAVAPKVADALSQAKARIETGDTAGLVSAQPDASPAGTIDQMTARNVADAAKVTADKASIEAQAARDQVAAATAHTDTVTQGTQAIHSAKVRDTILQTVLDDPTTLNPMERFRTALVKARIRDLSVSDVEATKIARWEGLRETLGAPQTEWSPNEMDPNLVRAAGKPRDNFDLKGGKVGSDYNRAPVRDETGRATDAARDPNAGQGEMFTTGRALSDRSFPTVEADQGKNSLPSGPLRGTVKAPEPTVVKAKPVGKAKAVSEAKLLRPEQGFTLDDALAERKAQYAAARVKSSDNVLPEPTPKARPAVESLRNVVNEAADQKAIGPVVHDYLMGELSKPAPNLDMVRSTVAKAAKRLEAANKVKPVDPDQAAIDAYAARRNAEAPQTSQEDQRQAQSRAPKKTPQESKQDAADRKAAQAAVDDTYGLAPMERPGSPSGMSKADVQSAADQHTAGWRGAPKVVVHQDMSTVPEHLQGGTPSGVYDPATKTVHLVADHIASPSDAHAALFHEALGHYGLRKAFGGRLDKMMSDVYRTNPKMRDLADSWIAEHNTPGSAYEGMSPAELKNRAMDEVFATASESGPQQGGGLKGVVARIKSYVKDFARRMGVAANYTHDDITDILRRAHASVTDGAPPTGSGRAASVPIQRPGLGGTIAQRFQNLSNPNVMKTTQEDMVADWGGKTRRLMLNMQDLNWLAEGHDKEFILNGEHLLTNWKDNLSRKDASKAAAIQKASGPHDLYLKLNDQSKADVDSLLLDGTLAHVEVREPRDPAKPPPGKVEQELRDRYAALDPKGRAAYDGMRQQFADEQKQLKDIFKSIIDQRDISDEEKIAAKDEVDARFKTSPGYSPLMRFGDFTVVGESPEWATAHDALEALKSKAAKATAETKPALQEEVKAAQKKFDAMQDEHRSVTSFEKESEMKRHADMLRKQGWDAREKLSSDFSASVDGVAGKFMSGIMDHLDSLAELHPDHEAGIAGIKSMINQMYLQQMPASSAMKRQMTRKGVAGFSKDVGRVYAASTQRTAGFIAEIKHGVRASELLEKMRTVADSSTSIRKKEIYNQLKKSFDLSKNYARMPITQFLNQASYAYFLSLSPSFTIMHTMQTPLVTLPMLGAIFGYGKSSSQLLKAASEVTGSYFSKYYHPGTEHLVGKTPGEQAALKFLVAHNLISGTETSQFMNASLGNPNALSKAGRAVMAVASYAPHHVERGNRMLTALATFRMAMEHAPLKKGVDNPASEHFVSDQVLAQFKADNPGSDAITKHELAATRLAEKITADSHVDYSATNSAYALQKVGSLPVLRLAAQFQKYQFGMLKVLGQNVSRSLDKSLTKEENKIAQRTLAGVIGTHAVMTGMMGLPGAGLAILAANIYHKALGDDDTPFDAETSFRNGLAGLLGKDAGDVAARGALYTPGIRDYLPADVTDRLGMGDLGNFANQTRVSEKINSDTMLGYLGSLASGPVGAMLGNMANAYQFEHEGNYQRALELLAPKALRDLSKAQRFSTAGVTTGTGMPVVSSEEVTTPDLVSQILGFTPQRVAEAYAQRSAMAEAKSQLEGRRSELIKKFTGATMDGEDTSDIRDQIKAFNDKQRDAGLRNQQLNMGTIYKAVQERKIAMRRLHGGISVSPRDRALRDQFGNYSATGDETASD